MGNTCEKKRLNALIKLLNITLITENFSENIHSNMWINSLACITAIRNIIGECNLKLNIFNEKISLKSSYDNCVKNISLYLCGEIGIEEVLHHILNMGVVIEYNWFLIADYVKRKTGISYERIVPDTSDIQEIYMAQISSYDEIDYIKLMNVMVTLLIEISSNIFIHQKRLKNTSNVLNVKLNLIYDISKLNDTLIKLKELNPALNIGIINTNGEQEFKSIQSFIDDIAHVDRWLLDSPGENILCPPENIKKVLNRIMSNLAAWIDSNLFKNGELC